MRVCLLVFTPFSPKLTLLLRIVIVQLLLGLYITFLSINLVDEALLFLLALLVKYREKLLIFKLIHLLFAFVLGQRLFVISDALHNVVFFQLFEQLLFFVSVDQVAHWLHDFSHPIFALGHLFVAFLHQCQLLRLDLLDFGGGSFLIQLVLN